MNFELTSEQQAVRAMAREWALAEVAPVIHHFDEQVSVSVLGRH